jgi:hypothetical protein
MQLIKNIKGHEKVSNFETKNENTHVKKLIIKPPQNYHRVTEDFSEEMVKCTINEISKQETRRLKVKNCPNFEQILNHRAQLIDWLVIVQNKLKHQNSSFFLTLDILDFIIEKYNFDLSLNDLHLVTVSSFFIASKNEEIRPIKLNDLLASVAHSKYTKTEIISSELLILTKLGYKIPKNNFLDFTNIILCLYFLKNVKIQKADTYKDTQRNYVQTIFNYCISIYKLIQLDFQMKRNCDQNLLFTSIVYFSIVSVNEFLMSYKNNIFESYLQFDHLNFIQFCENKFSIDGKKLNRTTALIQEKKRLFDNNLETFPFLHKEEFGCFSVFNENF